METMNGTLTLDHNTVACLFKENVQYGTPQNVHADADG